MQSYDVTIIHGCDTTRTVVQARSADEAMDQALLILSISWQRAESITAQARVNEAAA
jgi:hypothetical protein